MEDKFEFKAPQFVDFNSGLDDSDEADNFFDVEPETLGNNENKENIKINLPTINELSLTSGNEQKNDSLIEPAAQQTTLREGQKRSTETKRTFIKAFRRLSEVKIKTEPDSPRYVEDDANIEENLSENLTNVSLQSRKRTYFDGIKIEDEVEKQHCMITRNDKKMKTPKIELRTRDVAKSYEVKKNLKRKSVFGEEQKAPEKYMAMAEHILHFQSDTPPRFHSHRRRSAGANSKLLRKRQSYKPQVTIPITPKLMTKLRSRPVDVPSYEQRQLMELDEIKKHPIKANPLNEKIFLPPVLPVKHETQRTQFAPFNLTEVQKKAVEEAKSQPYKFTATPVPKAILEKPVGIAPKKELPITVPESPAITKPTWALKRVKVPAISNQFKESTENLVSFGVPMPESHARRTEVKPFSFEVRDKQMLEKKEKKIKEVLEAEKKAREFKANPLPSFVTSKDTTKSSHSNCSKMTLKNDNEEVPKTFKARSPRVLRKEPFKPVTDHAHSEPLIVSLHTDRRALERQEFEYRKAEKEEEIASIKQLMEIRKRDREEAEIAKLRKELIHKAQPMPKFKPKSLNLKIKSDLPLTTPQSPKFTNRVRKTSACSANPVKK